MDISDPPAPVYLVRGDDPLIMSTTTVDLVNTLVGDGERSLMVDEFTSTAFDAARNAALEAQRKPQPLLPLVNAANAGVFLCDRRVIVGRELGGFTNAESVAPLVDYLSSPNPTTVLVLAWEKPPNPNVRPGAPPKSLLEAIAAVNGVIVDAKIGSGKDQTNWVNDQLRNATVRLDAAARQYIAQQIGDDATRLVGLLPTLESVYGAGASLSVDEVAPYVGAAGSVKPWELTDAIDRGDTPAALDTLHRMLDNGMHPLQIMVTLTGHVIRMVTLDGSGITSETEAAKMLGCAPFMAKKAIAQGRKLGSKRLCDFTQLLADADLNLKGATALPPDVVMDLLVARLASRSR